MTTFPIGGRSVHQRGAVAGILCWVSSSIFFHCVLAFVNVPAVRRQALQSTMTSVPYEPAYVLTDAFHRNPFAQFENDDSAAIHANSEAWYSVVDWQAKRLGYSSSFAATIPFPMTSWLSRIVDNLAQPTNGSLGKWLAAQYIQAEYARRKLCKEFQVELHHFLRDSGMLRTIMDTLVTVGTPSLAMERPEIVSRFLQLTQQCQRIQYGPHEMQGIDMFFPSSGQELRGLLFFVVSNPAGGNFYTLLSC